MNLQYEYDLIRGSWKSLELTSIQKNGKQNSKETIDSIVKNKLYIRDLGYITPTYLKAVINKEASFLNRLPTIISTYTIDDKCIVWKNIDRKFNKNKLEIMEIDVKIYEKEKLSCKLII